MRDYKKEAASRAAWLAHMLAASGLDGFVFGSSGGKDSALVGILCKMASPKTLGIINPCGGQDADVADAQLLGRTFDIQHIVVDITDTKSNIVYAIGHDDVNIAPRLRMTTWYAIAAARRALVVGTSNRSEIYLGYSTKWGDAAHDINPIADLTATEVNEFLQALGAPDVFYKKPPSAGLYEGQTDEDELGFTYAELDNFLINGIEGANIQKIKRWHEATHHKREAIPIYALGPKPQCQ